MGLLSKRRPIRVTVVLAPSVRTQAFEQAKRSEPGMFRWEFVPPVSVEQVARRTVRAMLRGRQRVYCSTESYLSSLLARFMPWALDLALRLLYRGEKRFRHA